MSATIPPSSATPIPPKRPAIPDPRAWRAAYGPLDLKMPSDAPLPYTDWNAAYLLGQYAQREDSEDFLAADRTWGVANPSSPGGSGIQFGYSRDDESAPVASAAKLARPLWYNFEHYVRAFSDDITWWEKTHDPLPAQRIALYADTARAFYSEHGQVHLDDPGWVPDNLAQYHAMAQQSPHTALPWNGRAMGWAAYIMAMQLKVNLRTDTAWLTMFLDTCALAAIHGTGQVCSGPNTGGLPTNPVNTQYTFHWAILAHGAMAAAYRLGKPVPLWVIEGMNSLDVLAPIDYYGSPSIPAFTYSQGTTLVAAGGEGQHGDPMFGCWSTNCTVLAKLTKDRSWMTRAARWGPTGTGDEEARKLSMVYRGAIS